MRRAEPRPLAHALERLAPRLRPESLLAAVQAAWPEVAGPALTGEAEPVSERRGTVTIACRSSVWAHELSLLSEDLAARLNRALAEAGAPSPVGSLRFVVGDCGGGP